MSTKVRRVGGEDWRPAVTVSPGEIVQALIAYKNTGSEQHNNVVVKTRLPPSSQLVPGSVTFGSSSDPDGVHVRASGQSELTNNGINIGSYAPNGGTYVIFQVQASGESCSHEQISGQVETDKGLLEDAVLIAIIGEGCGS